jgi:hypothetical protein
MHIKPAEKQKRVKKPFAIVANIEQMVKGN